jgi:hypothetical protein
MGTSTGELFSSLYHDFSLFAIEKSEILEDRERKEG